LLNILSSSAKVLFFVLDEKRERQWQRKESKDTKRCKEQEFGFGEICVPGLYFVLLEQFDLY